MREIVDIANNKSAIPYDKVNLIMQKYPDLLIPHKHDMNEQEDMFSESTFENQNESKRLLK